MPGPERLKVTALNLFHPTASPIFEKVGFFILRHTSWAREDFRVSSILGGVAVMIYSVKERRR